MTKGPFTGLELVQNSAKANAAYITNSLINTHLITHPHLDHISGFVVNTAGPPATVPKRLAGLPSTIEALKKHVFNNVIWPNLSDENDGAGLVTFMRLMDGGSPALGEGDGKGYIEVCEGLSAKARSISHGHCIERHTHRGSNAGTEPLSLAREASTRGSPLRGLQGPRAGRSQSITSHGSAEATIPAADFCVSNSSAYFIRDQVTGREVLIFGDVEPDSISLSPRNKFVWSDAAPMIVSGRLRGILIECSFDDSQPEDRLYGHMSPKYLIKELIFLASEVKRYQELEDKGKENKKRKRLSNGNHPEELSPRLRRQNIFRDPSQTPSQLSPFSQTQTSPISTHTKHQSGTTDNLHSWFMDPQIPQMDGNASSYEHNGLLDTLTSRHKYNHQLKGLQIVIIHVKDNLDDGPEQGDVILKELQAHEEEAQLGCTFVVSKPGQSVYL